MSDFRRCPADEEARPADLHVFVPGERSQNRVVAATGAESQTILQAQAAAQKSLNVLKAAEKLTELSSQTQPTPVPERIVSSQTRAFRCIGSAEFTA
jgi:hypothetical protein